MLERSSTIEPQQKNPRPCLQQERGGQTHSGGLAPEWRPGNPILRDPPQPGKGSRHARFDRPAHRPPRLAATPTPTTPGYDPNVPYDPTEARRQRGKAIAGISLVEQKQPGFWTVPSQGGSSKYSVRSDGIIDDMHLQGLRDPRIALQAHLRRRLHRQRWINEDGSQTTKETLTARKIRQTRHRDDHGNVDGHPADDRQATDVQAGLAKLQHGPDEREALLSRTAARPLSWRRGSPGAQREGWSSARLDGRSALSAVFKVYSTVSGRRFTCDLQDALERGHLTRARTTTRSSVTWKMRP